MSRGFLFFFAFFARAIPDAGDLKSFFTPLEKCGIIIVKQQLYLRFGASQSSPALPPAGRSAGLTACHRAMSGKESSPWSFMNLPKITWNPF
jgi:hypothetical protein